ncbi:hypothetical protein N9L06_05755 [Mariniblastus sp.]|nr:hypothetical protein [Mariniblastus sp.]
MSSADRHYFLDDLRAAVIAGVPIDVGSSVDGSTFSSENLLTIKALDEIEDTVSAAGSNSGHRRYEGALPDRLDIAQQVFSTTNDMPLVLRGLSTANLASRKAIRFLRWTITYLMIVLLVAWLGMMFFAIVLVPEIQAMRADLLFSRRPEVASSNGLLVWIGYLAWIFGALLIAALIALSVGGIRKFVMLVGGRYFVGSRVQAIAMEAATRLVESGIDPTRANELACRLVGCDAKAAGAAQVVSLPRQNSNNVRQATSLHLRNGDRYLERIRATVPTFLVFLVGGCIGLVYCAAVFAPILALLRDLMISGV